MNIYNGLFKDFVKNASLQRSINYYYKKLKLKDDYLFFLPPDCEYTFNSGSNNEFLVLDIPDKMLNKYDMGKICGGN